MLLTYSDGQLINAKRQFFLNIPVWSGIFVPLLGELGQITQLKMVLRSVVRNALREKGLGVQLLKDVCSAFKTANF
ncbi:hypothetical protein [Mucilaginibacter sp.]|uniref:hypothetical protein n=1 Tax=Mucilaginibacter sp. TaxID=1882438 RepID=UPI002ED4C68F